MRDEDGTDIRIGDEGVSITGASDAGRPMRPIPEVGAAPEPEPEPQPEPEPEPEAPPAEVIDTDKPRRPRKQKSAEA